jgi:NAD+ synthase (glutamine-hydrolysing)
LKVKNIAYENAQARTRTMVLMNLANEENALQIGTGDLSELCLGWCTYNGDHMSMYSVNGSVPKTLVSYICKGFAKLYPNASSVLNDIIDTPISPELIAEGDNKISQKTEDIIGPYYFHDFILYHYLRYGYSIKKLFYLASIVFKDDLTKEEIKKWLKTFYRRFFQQQFKRSCLPEGAKIGTVSVSPRVDLKMPSDADVKMFLDEIDSL